MRIVNVRLNTTTRRAIPMAASPAGEDEQLWSVPNAFRDTCCVPLGILSVEALELTVVLESLPAPSARIWVEATAGAATGVFTQGGRGHIDPGDWQGGRAECEIPVDASAFRALGISWRRAIWHWQWGRTGRAGASLGSSEHLVFSTADSPTFPWSGTTSPASTEARPWAGPLALACEWAAGATSTVQAAKRVAALENNLPPGTGDDWRYDAGGRTYLNPGLGKPLWFFCAAFVSAVRDIDQTLPHRLSCYEAAAVVVTFANLLGCRLQPVVLGKTGCNDIRVNPIFPLGRSKQSGVTFQVHVAAADASAGTPQTALMYDSVLKLDTDLRPDRSPHTFKFPRALPAGGTTSQMGTGRYLPQLILHADQASATFNPVTPSQIAMPTTTDLFDPCDLARWQMFRRQLTADVGMELRPNPTMYDIKGFRATSGTALPAPAPEARRGLPLVPPRRRTLYLPVNAEDPGTRGMTLIADFWTGDRESTLSFMAELMATADRRPVRVEGQRGIVYSVSGGETLWILLDGATARLASVGPTSANLVQILKTATPLG